MVLPYEFALFFEAVLELPDELEGLSALNALTMRQVIHELALIDDIAFFVGALAMGYVVPELALVAITVSADVTSNSIDCILCGRCLEERLILEYELAFSVDAAFFPLALVEDSVAEVEELIEIRTGGQI